MEEDKWGGSGGVQENERDRKMFVYVAKERLNEGWSPSMTETLKEN